MRPLVAVLPLLLIVLGLSAAPLASAQATYQLFPGDTITHDEKEYSLTELVGSQNCKIFYDGAESPSLIVGDTVGELTVTEISNTYIILEGEEGQSQEEEEEENWDIPDPIAELRYTLESGDVLLFSDDTGVNGAMCYIFGETMNPTFLFWSGGRLPTISKTPTPDEKVSLSIGQRYESQTIWGLTVRVEVVDVDKVVVVMETDDSISLMKTTAGGQDISDVIDRLWANWEASLPTAPSPTDYTGVLIFGIFAILSISGVSLYMKYRMSWGQRWT